MLPLLLAADTVNAVDPRRFNRDIRSMLWDKCFACHGPDQVNRKSTLRLDEEARAKAVLGKNRFGIVPEHSKQSEVFKRISHQTPALRMPPTCSWRLLPPAEVETLRRWIEEGAGRESHCAFQPLVKPSLPSPAHHEWARTPVDLFVLDALEKAKLTPTREAVCAV